MKITIRKAHKNDWKNVQAIEHTVLEANIQYDPDMDINYSYSKEAIKYYKESIDSKDLCVILAEVDGVSAGYLIGGKFGYPYRKVTYGEIQGMGVIPEFRRMGLGSKLVDEFRKWAKSKGYQKLYVNTYYDDPRAVGFYKKQGLIPSDLVLIGKV